MDELLLVVPQSGVFSVELTKTGHAQITFKISPLDLTIMIKKWLDNTMILVYN